MAGTINRIPAPVVNRLPSPEVRFVALPVVDALPPPVLTPPSVDVPSFVPPSYEPPEFIGDPEPQQAPQIGPDAGETQESEVPIRPSLSAPTPKPDTSSPVVTPRPEIDVPFVGVVPLPYQREVALAGTTAVAATSAALLGKSMVEFLVKVFKPIVKRTMLRIKEKQMQHFNDFELQEFFEFEGRTPQMKKIKKVLEREKRDARLSQVEGEVQRRRQHKQKHMEKTDGSSPPLVMLHRNEVAEQVRNQVEP